MNEGELRRFIKDTCGPEVARALPTAGSLEDLFAEAVEVTHRRGYLDRDFFAVLRDALPRKRAEIRDLEASFCPPEPSDSPRSDEPITQMVLRPHVICYEPPETVKTETNRYFRYTLTGIDRGSTLKVVLREGTPKAARDVANARQSAVVFTPRNGTVSVSGSLYVRLRKPKLLRVGDRFALGDSHFSLVEFPPPECSLEVQRANKTEVVLLDEDVMILGRRRSEESTRGFDDPKMSRTHAEMMRVRGDIRDEYLLSDKGSANGTWLFVGKPDDLRHGDEIMIDGVKLAVSIFLDP